MGDVQKKALLDSFAELYGNGNYSDLIVQSSERQYNVHKAVICPRSPFFAAACRGNFREALTGVIELSGDSQIIDVMMHYFYHLDYPSPCTLVKHAQVSILADMYKVQGLGELAVDKFKAQVVDDWNTEDFMRAVEIIYDAPDSLWQIRSVVLNTFRLNKSLIEKRETVELIKSGNGLAYELLRHVWPYVHHEVVVKTEENLDDGALNPRNREKRRRDNRVGGR